MTIYGDYSRARIGWFFGLSGWQLGTLSVAVLPVAGAVSRSAWASAGLFLVLWALLAVVVAVPVRGRSVTGWLAATLATAAGGLMGWTRFRARATRGAVRDPAQADLPGVLTSIEVHEGPPYGPTYRRVALVQNHAARTWALTAAVVHPGLGLAEASERDGYGRGLSQLLDVQVKTELVSEVILQVRTVPEDGAERADWMARHRQPGAPAAARVINDTLAATLTAASVRTESFVTIVVPESRLSKVAKEYGGGVSGRARALHAVAAETESHLRAAVGASSVEWLTSAELATACRTGFAPGDRASLVEALAAHAAGDQVNTEVPWSMAGPSGADPAPRHYSHDAWNSVSSTLKLPVKGAAIGALAPILSTQQDGERRALMVCYPIVPAGQAARRSTNSEFAADLGEELNARARRRVSTRSRDEVDKVRRIESKLARGNSLTEPYAVATVTVPKTVSAAEAGRRLDAAIRRCGFAPMRLDLAQDVSFAATVVPLGVSLTRRSG
ncbi:SCO6880 family protein [uncultured Serinicoccus sp.]|uniref:SCO6880 family protein n=1 Tax=uncultured Serinicoccus sp. TaxID=735514 RepID=UPI002639D808|nr:SCO6880 family protein [uncultured Serinicoccus sp.]